MLERWHRHHGRVAGHRFAVAAVRGDGSVCGVAIVSRCSAKALDRDTSAEVVRCCTDGTPNACSLLYGASRRAWWAMGGLALYTYTLASEPGTSLRAAGFQIDAQLPERANWNGRGRPRPRSTDRCPARVRWVVRRSLSDA